MTIVLQLLSGLSKFLGESVDRLPGVGLSVVGGLMLLGLLAVLYLTRELFRQVKLLLMMRREARVKSPRRRLH